MVCNLPKGFVQLQPIGKPTASFRPFYALAAVVAVGDVDRDRHDRDSFEDAHPRPDHRAPYTANAAWKPGLTVGKRLGRRIKHVEGVARPESQFELIRHARTRRS